MHAIARSLALAVAATVLALAGATSVVAASDAAASRSVLDLHDAWCFDDSPGYQYCFEVEGTARFLDNRAGSSLMVNERMHTIVSKDGAVVGESFDTSMLRGEYRADGTVVTQAVVNSRAMVDGQVCHYSAVYRIADDRLVVDHVVPASCH